MKTQHTPGPWTVRDSDTSIDVRCEAEYLNVCTMDKEAIGTDREAMDAALADAQLISAAPDLLNELGAITDALAAGDIVHIEPGSVQAERMRKVVAKAEGK